MKKFLPLLLLASCAGASTEANFPDQPQVWGSLRGMMHQGITDAGTSISAAMTGKHMWGVGAVKDLDGEITIMNSSINLAQPVPNSEDAIYQNIAQSDSGVALLVLAEVEHWTSIPIDVDLDSQKALEAFIAKSSQAAGWDQDQILPFRVLGKTSHLQLHVIDGKRLEGAGNSHEEHIATAIKNVWKGTEVEMFGFRSLHHKAIFTHHDTTIHIHGVTADQSSGHVDEVAIKAGECVLLMPK